MIRVNSTMEDYHHLLQYLVISMLLKNISINTGITVYVYKKGQMTIPTKTQVYGSDRDPKRFGPGNTPVHSLSHTWDFMAPYTNYEYRYRIIQDELLALDQPSRRCHDDSEDLPSVSQCIAEYFEAKFNCSAYLLESSVQRESCINYDPENNPSANPDYDWKAKPEFEMNKDTEFEDWEMKTEVEIFDKTGCMPSCKRNEIRLDTVYETESQSYPYDPKVTLIFEYRDGMYNLNEEYLVYDFNNMVADIGGYLGLLLGHSMFSVYSMSADWITKPLRTIGNSLFAGNMRETGKL